MVTGARVSKPYSQAISIDTILQVLHHRWRQTTILRWPEESHLRWTKEVC